MNKNLINNGFRLDLQLIHHLLLRSSFSSDFGLFHGKMGILLFFYHYSKHTDNPVYEDFAGELLDDIWEHLHKKVPNNFASGLSGIAWGIEYLIQNGFVAGNSNEICEEIDCKIMGSDIRRINSEFIETELEGFLHYVLIRTSGSVKQTKKLPFDEMYRNDLFQVFGSLQKQEKISETSHSLIGQYLGFISGRQTLDYNPNLLAFIDESEIKEKAILTSPPGLKTGLAGRLYKQITDSTNEKYLYFG